jgi:hypothetical protein
MRSRFVPCRPCMTRVCATHTHSLSHLELLVHAVAVRALPAVHDARVRRHRLAPRRQLLRVRELHPSCEIQVLPRPVLIPKQLGLGFNKPSQQLCFQFQPK